MSRSLRISGAFVLALVALGLFTMSCEGEGQLEQFACPRRDVFIQAVSPYLERRCGSLDCHGQMTRPMRLYSEFGLRHPTEGNFPGGVVTTQEELGSNFLSVCNVQPEAMAEVAQDFGVSADKLLLVNKARGLERHKGGKIVDAQDPGDRCITGWLGLTDPAEVKSDCDEAIGRLE